MLGALFWRSSGACSLELDAVLFVPLRCTFGHEPRYLDASGGLVRGGTGGGRSGGRWNPFSAWSGRADSSFASHRLRGRCGGTRNAMLSIFRLIERSRRKRCALLRTYRLHGIRGRCYERRILQVYF